MANPLTMATTATRHMLDANVSFGMASDRYNAQDKYRRSYSADERIGAGIGAGLGVVLPVAAGVAFVQKGMKIPGMPSAFTQGTGRAAGIAMLGLAAGVGASKSIEIAKDDGHLGGAGAAVGLVGGAVAGYKAGQRVGGKLAAVSTTAGAVLGAVAGNFAGKQVKVGEGHLGEANVQQPQVDAGAGGRVKSFARGAFNHFTEVGPTTQGMSFGFEWGMRDAVQTKYSNSERAGAMHGDLLAAGILGGGALGVAAGLVGLTRHADSGISGIRAGVDIAGSTLARGTLTGMTSKLSSKGALGVGAAAVGIAGLMTAKAYQSDSETYGADTAKLVAAGTLAATGVGAAMISRSGAMKAMAPGARAANGALAAAAIIGVLSSARLPLQQFMNDVKDTRAAGGTASTPVTALATGVGAVGGGLATYSGLSKLVPSGGLQLGRFHIPKGAIVGLGTAVGAGAAGGIGFGLSSTMPDIKTVGMSVAGGAVAGAGAGMLLGGVGPRSGAVIGAALGLSASALLNSGGSTRVDNEIELAPAGQEPAELN